MQKMMVISNAVDAREPTAFMVEEAQKRVLDYWDTISTAASSIVNRLWWSMKK